MSRQSQFLTLAFPAIFCTLVLPPAFAATEVIVDGMENAIFGGDRVVVNVPPEVSEIEALATGTAMASDELVFGGVLVAYHHSRGGYMHVFLPQEGAVLLTNCVDRIDIFFVDEEPQDNSGIYDIELLPVGGPPMDPVQVSARDHCIDVSRAALAEPDAGSYEVSAEGQLWWGGPGSVYSSIALMFDVATIPPMRTYATVELNEGFAPLDEPLGGPVRLFVADLSGAVYDNGGEALVIFEPVPSPVQLVTWGRLKSLLSH